MSRSLLSPRTAPYWARHACPLCGARPYERCMRPNGTPTVVHDARSIVYGKGSS